MHLEIHHFHYLSTSTATHSWSRKKASIHLLIHLSLNVPSLDRPKYRSVSSPVSLFVHLSICLLKHFAVIHLCRFYPICLWMQSSICLLIRPGICSPDVSLPRSTHRSPNLSIFWSTNTLIPWYASPSMSQVCGKSIFAVWTSLLNWHKNPLDKY